MVEPDFTMDELLLTIDCDEVGFLVTIKNNGSETWKTPIDTISTTLDPLDGSSSVGEISKNWGAYNETNEWVSGIDPMLQTSSLSLVPGESVTYRVGTSEDTKVGKLTVILKSNTQARATESKICIPSLSVKAECSDSTGNESGLPRFLITHDVSSSKMNIPLNYIIQEKDENGTYKDVDDQDHNSFQLPSAQNDSTWYVNIYDKFNQLTRRL